jgi:GTP-binding protein
MNIKQVTRICRFYDPKEVEDFSPLPKIAVAGRSNVGKSSFINSLLQAGKITGVSSRPGKTRTIDCYRINDRFILADLPGFGYARRSKDDRRRIARLITAFIRRISGIRLIILLMDCRREPGELEAEYVDLMLGKKIKILTVLTKSDKLSKLRLTNKLVQIEAQFNLNAIPYSIKSAQNRKIILDLMREGLKEKK